MSRSVSSLGFALVGAGRIGERHAGHIGSVGRLLAVCDIEKPKADKLAAPASALAFEHYDDMLEALEGRADVVSICTPNGIHADQTIKALKRGFHVLCEKPMALSVHECGEMIKAAERANRRLFVVKQNRFNPPVQHLKDIVENGTLGRIYSVHLNCYWNRNDAYYANNWRGTLSLDGGTLYTQFSHFIDLIYWLAGDVQDVAAFTANYAHKTSVEFEDSGVAVLRFYSGAIGSVCFTINSHNKNMEGSITIHAENGSVKIGGQYLNELEYENVKDLGPTRLREGRGANQYGEYQGSMSNHEDVYRNLHDVLMNGGEISTAGYEGLKTVEIIDKIYRAARASSAR